MRTSRNSAISSSIASYTPTSISTAAPRPCWVSTMGRLLVRSCASRAKARKAPHLLTAAGSRLFGQLFELLQDSNLNRHGELADDPLSGQRNPYFVGHSLLATELPGQFSQADSALALCLSIAARAS